MTISTNPQESFNPFLPSTVNFPEEEDRFKTFLVDLFSNYADVINDKKIGVYVAETPKQNGNEHWYSSTKVNHNGFQSFLFIKGLPNAGVLVINLASTPKFPIDNIGTEFLMWHMWGTCSKPPTAIGAGDGDFFGFNNEGNTQISFVMTDTTITITTTVDLSAYYCFLVFEFIRNGTQGT